MHLAPTTRGVINHARRHHRRVRVELKPAATRQDLAKLLHAHDCNYIEMDNNDFSKVVAMSEEQWQTPESRCFVFRIKPNFRTDLFMATLGHAIATATVAER